MIPAPDIPGHTVSGVLGSGGFATVYRTWQLAVGRETAVKIDNRVLHTERDQRRFLREVTAAGQLSGHPHVIDVYDAGTLRDGRPYLVMELCPAGSLRDELHRNGPLSAEQAGRIGISLADALAAAHAAGILHRDIKPGNILINRYGVVGLSDFGLASIIAASGEQSVSREALTPAYAPPESFEAAEPTVAADIYSLAATLYTLMAGQPPRYSADTMPASLAAIAALHSRPVDDIPGVPAGMLAILRQCLAADPAQRLPSAAAFRDELARLFGPPRSGDTTPPHRARFAPSGESGSSGPGSWTVPDAGPGMWSHATPDTSTAAAVSHGRAATARTPRLRTAKLAAVAGGSLVVLAAGAWLIGTSLIGSDPAPASTGSASTGPAVTGPAGVIGAFGIATTTSHCPAAAVPGAGARCPVSPECWQGLVEIEGIITASPLPCTGAHSWQTFAIGIMPTDASTYNVNIVQANPIVRAVCSDAVLLRSRTGQARRIPPNRWTIQVLPPDEAAYDSGIRTYRCLASLGYARSRTSQFGIQSG